MPGGVREEVRAPQKSGRESRMLSGLSRILGGV